VIKGLEAPPAGQDQVAPLTAFVDFNLLIRHLTGDPPDMARRATALIREVDEMLLADLILAEIIYVLESFYQVARHEVARLAGAVLAFPSIRTIDPALPLRAIEV